MAGDFYWVFVFLSDGADMSDRSDGSDFPGEGVERGRGEWTWGMRAAG